MYPIRGLLSVKTKKTQSFWWIIWNDLFSEFLCTDKDICHSVLVQVLTTCNYILTFKIAWKTVLFFLLITLPNRLMMKPEVLWVTEIILNITCSTLTTSNKDQLWIYIRPELSLAAWLKVSRTSRDCKAKCNFKIGNFCHEFEKKVTSF